MLTRLPPSVVTIGEYAFSETGIKFISLPENTRKIGVGCFNRCESLLTINLQEKLHNIEDSAFSGCERLKSIYLPKSITAIGSFAFLDCLSLETINIPENVTIIGLGAFNGCTSLSSMVMPKSIAPLPVEAIAQCPNLKNVRFVESTNQNDKEDDKSLSSRSMFLKRQQSSPAVMKRPESLNNGRNNISSKRRQDINRYDITIYQSSFSILSDASSEGSSFSSLNDLPEILEDPQQDKSAVLKRQQSFKNGISDASSKRRDINKSQSSLSILSDVHSAETSHDLAENVEDSPLDIPEGSLENRRRSSSSKRQDINKKSLSSPSILRSIDSEGKHADNDLIKKLEDSLHDIPKESKMQREGILKS
jgi:hypothetical protein